MANIENMRGQLRSMGASFAWDSEVVTCDPEFYVWNQWLFLQFLEAGLAYRAVSPVDWCPNDGTLAREQVEGTDRRCWRCGAKVEKRELAQWYLQDDELRRRAAGLHGHRLARSPSGACRRTGSGARAARRSCSRPRPRPHHAGGQELRVFTTRPDTLFGATFMVARAGAPAGQRADRPGSQGRRRGLRQGDRGRRPRSTACRPTARRPACRSAPTRSTRSTGSGSRSSSPTTSWAPTGPARSWPSRPTTSATSRSRRSYGLPIVRVIMPRDGDPDEALTEAFVQQGGRRGAGR